MKVSKIFGFVLFLHLGVIGVLVVQPGCSTTQPPTQTYEQDRTMRPSGSTASGGSVTPRTPDGLIPATRVDGGMDPAFNAGFEGDEGFAPRRPQGGVDAVDPLEPMPSEGQTVDVAGPSFETYTVKRGDTLWGLSKRFGVSVNELYEANGLNENSVLRVGRQIQIPSEGGTASVRTVTADSYQPSGYSGESVAYTVRAGDTLSRIAKEYDTTVRAIKAANGKTSDMIRVGEELVIPVSGGSGESGASDAAGPAPAPSTGSTSGDYRTHTVQAGEYPAEIARRYGMTTNELLALNGITDPRNLRVGTELKVSASGSARNVDGRTETASAPAPSVTRSPAPAPAPAPAPGNEAPEIRVVEADPLVEGEFDEADFQGDDDADAMFEDAVEIPVIRLEDEE